MRAREDSADSPYHAGERALQQQLGVRERSEQMGRKMIRDAMPEQHRALFRQLPFIVVGSLDESGQPWASLLAGPAGFVAADDPYTLRVNALPSRHDPLSQGLAPTAALGLLAIELQTRRRNRVNGRVIALDGGGFTLHVDQSFGNCPKYITPRTLRFSADAASERQAPLPLAEGRLLSDAAVALIEAADTCFIASASSPLPAAADTREGVDVSHRGGIPGFVRVLREPVSGQTQLLLPDYAGNNAFNTLGNLMRYPRAGLLFVDFEQAEVLSLSCAAQVVTDDGVLAAFAGASRVLRCEVSAGVRLRSQLVGE